MRSAFLGRAGTLLLALALLGVAGCFDNSATLSGEVSYEGKPVEDGQVTLEPADGKGPVSGGKIVNGRYTATGVPAGPKIVKIEGYKKVNFASSSEEMQRRAEEMKRKGNDTGLVDPADTIPANAVGNNVKLEVTPGTHTHNFHLKKPGSKPG